MNSRFFARPVALRLLLLVVLGCTALRAQTQVLSLLHEFTGGTGAMTGVVETSNGLVGSFQNGGTGGFGGLYRINADGTGFTVIHNFTNTAADGASPIGQILYAGGVLYGFVWNYPGTSNSAIYKINPDGTGLTLLHAFAASGAEGSFPVGRLVLVGSTLYGATRDGGNAGRGTIYKVNTDGTGFAVLRQLSGLDGYAISSGLLYSGGALYGVSELGGNVDRGTVFRINPDGSGYSAVKVFLGNGDGAYPMGLMQTGGFIYGTTARGGAGNRGTVFRLTASGAAFTTLATLPDGYFPAGNLIEFGGRLRGSASVAIFSLNLDGSGVTVDYTLSEQCQADLHVRADGSLTLVNDGILSPVRIYRLSPASALGTWRSVHGLASSGSQDFANPSGDGIANLLKYAFGTAPNAGDLLVPNRSGMPVITSNGQTMTFSFNRRKAGTQPGINYVPEISADLQTWAPVSLAGASTGSIDFAWEQVTLSAPVPSARRSFGRVSISWTNYSNSFETEAIATLRGNATLTGGLLQLTSASPGQMGSAILDGIAAGEGQTGFNASFQLGMGSGSAPPADGMSFSVGNMGTAPFGEDGPMISHSLTLSFDTYNNGTGVGAAIGIRLLVNGVMLASSSTNPYTNGALVPAVVTYTPAEGLSLTWNGTPIFTGVAVPAFALQTGDRFGFGGRTGGLWQRNVVDDVTISPR